jgi:hypothetical protein
VPRELLHSPPAPDLTSYRRRVSRWGQVEELGEERCRLTMQVDDLAWTMFVLAALEAPFDIEGPDELRERTTEVAERFARAARR